MSQTPIAATHVVFASPRILNGALYRGVVATDVPDTIGQQLDRDLWVVLLLLHGASVPTFHVDIDLYLTSLTYADKCPHPQLHLTDRNFINENKFFPLSLPKQYDVIFNANWMTLKRHELLIEALEYAQEQGRPIRCLWFGYHWCAGFTDREEMLRETVRAKSLPVDFMPSDFSVQEINRRYNLCRSAVMCSATEGGPLVMGEAILADLPYIVTNDTRGGSPEMVVSDCGVRCEPTGKSIAEAVWYSLDHRDKFHPRRWALENLCVSVSLKLLRDSLLSIGADRGWPINVDELQFPGYDWQGRKQTVRTAETRIKEFYGD